MKDLFKNLNFLPGVESGNDFHKNPELLPLKVKTVSAHWT